MQKWETPTLDLFAASTLLCVGHARMCEPQVWGNTFCRHTITILLLECDLRQLRLDFLSIPLFIVWTNICPCRRTPFSSPLSWWRVSDLFNDALNPEGHFGVRLRLVGGISAFWHQFLILTVVKNLDVFLSSINKILWTYMVKWSRL